MSECDNFRCYLCGKQRPGHYPTKCPSNDPKPAGGGVDVYADDYEDPGYDDYDDDAMGNMTGEPYGATWE